MTWSPFSWKSKPAEQLVQYADPSELEAVLQKLGTLPPLVTSWEIERLKELLADAQRGNRFVLQGGDCAETLADCRPDVISNKLKILLQMSLVLVHGSYRPVVRVGRFAGQYAKPRSKLTETRAQQDGTSMTLPSYFGDLVNHPQFDESSRRADPKLLLEAYTHAAMTLNFIRSLTKSGFADLHHPEYWDLSFFENADLPSELRREYQQTSEQLSQALRFMEALGETSIDDLTQVEFFTSHEGLNLWYESAQTRGVPRRRGFYDLTTHLPWIGERTRGIDGAHVEFFRGIRNPVGVKLGPASDPEQVVRLVHTLNPEDEPGKVLLIVRMGAEKVADGLGRLVERVQQEGKSVLWMCDPMHGNTRATSTGIKTRNFDDILKEIELSFDVHHELGSYLGGVHFELTGEDVTECVGGAAGVTESDLDRNYASLCDPRLNYRQSLEMAFRIASRMSRQNERRGGGAG
jgi:3-deoxy-7-phosphoheptulonate synthase